jgi:hypothetical protein
MVLIFQAPVVYSLRILVCHWLPIELDLYIFSKVFQGFVKIFGVVTNLHLPIALTVRTLLSEEIALVRNTVLAMLLFAECVKVENNGSIF